MKKFLLAVSAATLIFAMLFSACAPAADPVDPDQNDPPADPPVLTGGYEGTDGGVSFTLPALGESVALHTELQSAYLGEENAVVIGKYADGVNAGDGLDHRELSHPLPVTFTWEAAGISEGAEYLLRVGEGEEMQNVWSFSTTETSLAVYNLKLATTYYWSVEAEDTESGKAFFTTEGRGPRNLYVDGVANVRDLGGWLTESGGRFKQGLIYRCGRLNENYTGKTTITEAGKRTMLEELKIRTEIDLRGGKNDPSEHGNITQSPLGEGVAYHHLGMNWEGDMLTLNRAKLREIFTLLSDETNYPLIFHCSIGTDRTGLVAYLLGAIVGVRQEDLFRDYLFSNFAYIEGSRGITDIKNSYAADIDAAAGDTLAEKAKNYLTEKVRIPAEQIEEIVRILAG